MTSNTHLVIPDTHCHPDYNNDRADYLSKLIIDLRPDIVVHLGDGPDMSSMSGYDKGTKSFHGRSYKRDIDSFLDFEDRVWAPVKRRKRKLPRRIYCEGNHCHRIKRGINLQPELEGAISFNHLELERFYDDVVEYEGNTPGVINVDGIYYAHFFVSGVMGKPVGGEHAAYSLLTKEFVSCTCGHIHTLDFSVRTTVGGKKIYGLVAGVYQDYDSDWAGKVNDLWHRGVVVKRSVDGHGSYDAQIISLDALAKEYGGK